MWLALGIFVSANATAFIIIVTELLPPGIIDPDSKNLRYISDGFEDHRISPFLCLVLIFVNVVCLLIFSIQAALHVAVSTNSTNSTKPPKSHVWRCACFCVPWVFLTKDQLMYIWVPALFFSALCTIVGFGLLAVNATGPVHYAGASIFILMHMVMQFTFLHIMSYVVSTSTTAVTVSSTTTAQEKHHHTQHHIIMSKKNKASDEASDDESSAAYVAWSFEEYAILAVAGVGGIIFGLLLLVAYLENDNNPFKNETASNGRKTILLSYSAGGEYFVFLGFVLMNILASSIVTYISLHYESVPVVLDNVSSSIKNNIHGGKVQVLWRKKNLSSGGKMQWGSQPQAAGASFRPGLGPEPIPSQALKIFRMPKLLVAPNPQNRIWSSQNRTFAAKNGN